MIDKLTQFKFGKDENDNEIIFDMSKSGHLLIAGDKGMGQTDFIKSLLIQLTKKEGEYGLVVFNINGRKYKEFANHPKLLNPIMTDIGLFSGFAYWLRLEMERRYSLLEHLQVDDFESYNKKSKKKLERIFLIIDDLAVEPFFTKKVVNEMFWWPVTIGKAVGIHIICGTSSVRVNYLPGSTWVSLTNHLSFKMTSRRDANIFIQTDEVLNLKPKKEAYIRSVDIEDYKPTKLYLSI